ncbi:MAG: phospholipase D-like domain-containing protein [Gemmatimonadota bacterium]|nr:phospholipase D-like domain-containing protein [Gemmatimonadota bacterium]
MNPFGHPAWWLLALAVVGLFAISGVVLTLFFALGRRPDRLRAPHVPSLDPPDDFLLALAGTVNAPTRAGGAIRMLNNGAEFFPAILDDIRAARRTVNVMVYIWEAGEVSDGFHRALLERARAGVQVRVMLDGMGAFWADRARFRALTAAGGKVYVFRPFHLGQLTRFYKRNHRRSIVIDGEVGYTGGAAVSDKWLGNADSPEHWRDSMFRVTGPPARSLQAVFTELWASTYGEILAGPDFFPFDAADDTEGEGTPVARHVNVISSPAREAHPLRKVFWLSFMAARRRLWITTPYFVPDKHLRSALADQARAGVDVRLLLPGQLTDAKPVFWAARSYYQPLLDAGVRIWEYQPTFVHSKTLVVDGVWSVVGSANLDVRSKELNQENVLGILDRGFAEELERVFLADLERAKEMKPDEWRRRGLAERAQERFWVLFAEQY